MRAYLGISWQQGVCEVGPRNDVVVDAVADEGIEGAGIFDEKSHSGVECGAAGGESGRLLRMLGDFCDEADGGGAVQDACCDAAAEW